MPSHHESESRTLIRNAVKQYSRLAMTTGLNLSGIVLLDLAATEGFRGDVLFVDTGFHFPQTLDLWQRLANRYRNVNFITLNALQEDAEREALYATDPTLCCETNKVRPLSEHLTHYHPQALLNARTQFSASTRSDLGPIEHGDPLRINPLYAWNRTELEDYADHHELETHPLYDEGYLSLGCWPCTRALRPGEDIRAGRFDGQGRSECGIWTQGSLGTTTPIPQPQRQFTPATTQGVS